MSSISSDFLSLPYDLKEVIFKRLSRPDLVHLSETCKELHELVKESLEVLNSSMNPIFDSVVVSKERFSWKKEIEKAQEKILHYPAENAAIEASIEELRRHCSHHYLFEEKLKKLKQYLVPEKPSTLGRSILLSLRLIKEEPEVILQRKLVKLLEDNWRKHFEIDSFYSSKSETFGEQKKQLDDELVTAKETVYEKGDLLIRQQGFIRVLDLLSPFFCKGQVPPLIEEFTSEVASNNFDKAVRALWDELKVIDTLDETSSTEELSSDDDSETEDISIPSLPNEREVIDTLAEMPFSSVRIFLSKEPSDYRIIPPHRTIIIRDKNGKFHFVREQHYFHSSCFKIRNPVPCSYEDNIISIDLMNFLQDGNSLDFLIDYLDENFI